MPTNFRDGKKKQKKIQHSISIEVQWKSIENREFFVNLLPPSLPRSLPPYSSLLRKKEKLHWEKGKLGFFWAKWIKQVKIKLDIFGRWRQKAFWNIAKSVDKM